MLSNKLTFSLASLILVLMIGLCVPIEAQEVPLPAATIDAGEWHVFGKAAAGAGGITSTAYTAVTDEDFDDVAADAAGDADLDLEEFFRFGGTVELVVTKSAKDSKDLGEVGDAPEAFAAKDLVISEIMWALDDSGTGKQWIEIYNTSDLPIVIADAALAPVVAAAGDPNAGNITTIGALAVKLVFTPFTDKVTKDTDTAIVSDRISNVHRGKWAMPGSSGVTAAPGNAIHDPPQANLISAYRNIDYNKVKGQHVLSLQNVVQEVENRKKQLEGIPDGRFLASWKATPPDGSRNMMRWYIGSPGTMHVPGTAFTFDVPTTTIPSNSVVINEVRNDTSAANVDWVELYNNGTDPVNLYDWELTLLRDAYKTKDLHKNDSVLVGRDEEYSAADQLKHSFPKGWMLEAGAYLLIVNRHPQETTLANGVNVDDVLAGREIKAGATHEYIIREKLDLPDDNITLLLRNAVDKNARHKRDRKDDHAKARTSTDVASSEKIMDHAGNVSIVVGTSEYNTQFWPFRGWEGKTADTGKDAKGESFPKNKAWSRKSYTANRGHHNGSWVKNGVGHQGGIGYDPGVDLRIAPGTPGYANNALKSQLIDGKGTRATSDDVPFDGMISISEVMVDAGPRWNLVQWIELYNSSMTEVINLKDWELEIRNATDDVESYVDSGFSFNDAYILPNQTLLLVSGTGTNDVADNRVYNLYQNHRKDLGLSNRRSVLLSPVGFFLRLTDKNDDVVDEAGNVEVKGATRTVMWELPARGDIRQSLVRQYGSRVSGSGASPADDGTMMDSWNSSELEGAGLSFYGHRDDAGTPGFRLGGPLPVTLSKFRPVRNQDTGHVDITWITQSELNNAGFNILRSEAKNGEFKVINVKGIVAGHGTTSEKHVYTFTDTTAKPNVVYYYQIEDVSINGLRTTLTTTHLRGHVGAAGKLTTRWGELKSSGK